MKKLAWLILFLPLFTELLGILSNILVTMSNHGLMPVVLPQGVALGDSWNHIQASASTHFNFLADWIASNEGMKSPGDILQRTITSELQVPCYIAGAGFLLQRLLEKRNSG